MARPLARLLALLADCLRYKECEVLIEGHYVDFDLLPSSERWEVSLHDSLGKYSFPKNSLWFRSDLDGLKCVDGDGVGLCFGDNSIDATVRRLQNETRDRLVLRIQDLTPADSLQELAEMLRALSRATSKRPEVRVLLGQLQRAAQALTYGRVAVIALEEPEDETTSVEPTPLEQAITEFRVQVKQRRKKGYVFDLCCGTHTMLVRYKEGTTALEFVRINARAPSTQEQVLWISLEAPGTDCPDYRPAVGIAEGAQQPFPQPYTQHQRVIAAPGDELLGGVDEFIDALLVALWETKIVGTAELRAVLSPALAAMLGTIRDGGTLTLLAR